MSKLKPCPFCGGPGTIDRARNWDGGDDWGAYCDNEACLMGGVYTHIHPTKEGAIKAWNTRGATAGQLPHNEYTVRTTSGKEIKFTGRYRRDLETNNWRYYERADGRVIHFRKEHKDYIDGDTVESITAAKVDN